MDANRTLVVGLGNPGREYETTRHNLGFMVVQAFVEKHGWPFKKSLRLKGLVAQGTFDEHKVISLLPTRYMNLSGGPVVKAKSYYKVALSDLIVVVDDSALPFGKLRLRPEGSAGGHNGLKDIESHLGPGYPRLRMGIGQPKPGQILHSFVLEPFTVHERNQLPALIEHGVAVIECWLRSDYKEAQALAGQLQL